MLLIRKIPLFIFTVIFGYLFVGFNLVSANVVVVENRDDYGGFNRCNPEFMLPGVTPCNTRQVHVTNYLPGGGEGKYFYLEGFTFLGHDHDDGVTVDVFIHEEGTSAETWKRIAHEDGVSTDDGLFCGDRGSIYGVSYHNFYGNPKIAHTNPTDDRCNESSRFYEIYPKNTSHRIDKIRLTFKLGDGNTNEKHVHIKSYTYRFSGYDLLKIVGYAVEPDGTPVANVDVRVKNGGSDGDPNNFKYGKTNSQGYFEIDPSGIITKTAPYYNVTVMGVPNTHVWPPRTQWPDWMGQCDTGGPYPPRNAYECQNLTNTNNKLNCTLRGCNFVVTPNASANNPPVCGAVAFTKVPNKTYYLPNEEISLTATNFTDPNNDPIIVTNWTTTAGTLKNISANKLNSTFVLPSGNNQLATVSYVISDGKSNTTCSTNFTTKLMFSCANNSCVQDSSGIYTTLNDCMAYCTGANNNYSCNSGGQCVLDPVNGTYPTSNCNNECGSQQVTCNNINVGGNLLNPGGTVSLSASVSNFTTPATTVNYSWVSLKGNPIDISSDPNCNTATNICTMNANSAYTTAGVSYTVPSATDTVYFKINNAIVPTCVLNVNNTANQQDISLNFEYPSYTINTGSNNSVNLLVSPADNISTYSLNLTCTVDSTITPCAPGTYNFTDNGSTMLVLSNIQANQTYTKNVTLNFPNATGVTLNVIGGAVPPSANLVRTASTHVSVVSPLPLNYSVKYNSNFLANKSDYCTSGAGVNFSDIVLDFGPQGGPQTSYNLSTGAIFPTTIVPGNYTISASLINASLPQEIKCVKVNAVTANAISTSFNVVSGPTTVTYVVGPHEGNTWYQAFGGSAFSKGGFINPIADTSQRLLTNFSNISAGVLQTNSTLNVPQSGNLPEKHVIYPSSDSLSLNHLQKLTTDLNASTIAKINDISQIQYSSASNFYYFDGDLTITSNMQATSGQEIPVVYVSGDVVINSSVTNVDLFIISNKSITLGNDPLIEIDLTVKGALIANNSFNFNSLKTVPNVDGKLTEKIYFDPSIYFSNSLNSKFFKNINIFANLID